MAGKKQPGLIDMVSVLLEEIEKNRESTKDLFVVADTLNSKLEYDVHNQPWSENSVKKAISKIKISKNLTF